MITSWVLTTATWRRARANTIETLLWSIHAAATVCTVMNSQDVMVEIGTNPRVAIVGHFPFEDRVRRRAAECWIVELQPRPGLLDGTTVGARAAPIKNEHGWLVIYHAQ